ncbi:ubinuclein-2-like isoform X2 [Lytechinus pictus]|uniref:ubinuclein-2-like isoform X2 n=1 Tax=Lytechinus pictus TaxID=7653 RepID=UPI0030B9B88C
MRNVSYRSRVWALRVRFGQCCVASCRGAMPGEESEEAREAQTFNDIHEEDLQGLEAIAKQFEEKYNKPGKKGKKKKMLLEDLIDAGMGYDETDPFVDNSECYDELVPASLTTQFGGFYINSGQLKFKEISDSEDGDFQKPRTPKKKKRLKLENGDGKREKKMKRKLSSESGSGDHISKKTKKQLKKKAREEKKKKKKGPRLIRTPTVAELLKRNTGSLPGSPQSHPATSTFNGPPSTSNAATSKASSSNTTTTPGLVSSSGGAQAAPGVDMSLDLGISVADLDKETMEMVDLMNGTDGMMGGVVSTGGMAAGSGGDQDSDLNISPSAPGIGGEDGGAKEKVNLPQELPLQLLDNIQKIKEAARKSVEGKTKFFNSHVNGLLLKIEHGTRMVNCSKRSAVYSHLAFHLPCTKLTLQKRAKKLQLGVQDNHLKEPLQRLREAIAEVMPDQQMRYKTECEEVSLKMDLGPTHDSEGKVIELKPPKKKFIWDDRLRALLCEVVKVKVKTFEISKTRTQSAEEYLKAFLESDVKNLWPKDWIQTRNLFKESRAVHDHVTSIGKQRKSTPGAPRKLLLTTIKKTLGSEDVEGSSTIPQGSSETQEFEPSSTQANEMIGSPVTTKHIEDVPTLVDCMGSGEDSMDAMISSSHLKGTEYATASSDSNQEASPVVATAQTVPVSSTSPLPHLDPGFLVDQMLNQQLVTNSQVSRPAVGGASSSNIRTLDMNVKVQGTKNIALMPETVKLAAMSTGEMLPKQAGVDSMPSQQSCSAALSAISNMHSRRTMHKQEPGLQAKDVTSSSMMSKVRPSVSNVAIVGNVPRSEMQLGQPVIRLKRDSKLEKMNSNSRLKVQGIQHKGQASPVPKSQTILVGGVHTMPYSQSASNTSLQGRSSNVTTQRIGGGMDPLPQMSSQVAPGNGNIRLSSSSSQSTSRRSSYVSPTNTQQRAAGSAHSPGSAFSTPSQHSHLMKAQASPSIPQQTSPSAYSSTTPRQYTSPHQQYSPGHTSPIAAGYSTTSPSSYQTLASGGGYQQMPLSDMTARQQTTGGTNYTNNYPMVQSSTQGGVPQSPVGDAVITGPAPGTFYHQSPTGGGLLPPHQTTPSPSHPLPPDALDLLCAHQAFADARYTGDTSSNQHRII